jgi:hypothetical protein
MTRVAQLAIALAAITTAMLPRITSAQSDTTLRAGASAQQLFLRINQVGYLTTGPKFAVACALRDMPLTRFTVETSRGERVKGDWRISPSGPFGPCIRTWRLDFGDVKTAGRYRLRAGEVVSPIIRVGPNVYAGLADTLLSYMRQQRSGYNPFLRDSAHRFDGIVVDHPTRTGDTLRASGGWADAADYLQYVATSATATTQLLMAHRDNPRAFGDRFNALGLPGRNGTPDVLDEARHGLEWLLRMFPSDSLMLNQLGDDRDHTYWDLVTTDSSDYGWGKGGARPLYPCTGQPQGLFAGKNRSTGWASTAGKYTSALAMGAQAFAKRDPAFADSLRHRAIAAYYVGRAHPGVCQTAPGKSPYFYEEANWVDDMELGATALHSLTGDARYLRDAVAYAEKEPVTPWMGADTARHYEFYPFHNAGHFEIWRAGSATNRATMIANYRRGIERVAYRAHNGFRVGVPFIWCSNDLLVSFGTQALLYRRMTGDTQFLELETAALDWLFGANPWGTSMVIGVPGNGVYPRDPHTELPKELHGGLRGGLVDGPVYRSIYYNLKGIRLLQPDEFERFNVGHIVYHDDLGDYATNEHIMDGTANLAYLLSSRAPQSAARATATKAASPKRVSRLPARRPSSLRRK